LFNVFGNRFGVVEGAGQDFIRIFDCIQSGGW
jgi:hypothetical protein